MQMVAECKSDQYGKLAVGVEEWNDSSFSGCEIPNKVLFLVASTLRKGTPDLIVGICFGLLIFTFET